MFFQEDWQESVNLLFSFLTPFRNFSESDMKPKWQPVIINHHLFLNCLKSWYWVKEARISNIPEFISTHSRAWRRVRHWVRLCLAEAQCSCLYNFTQHLWSTADLDYEKSSVIHSFNPITFWQIYHTHINTLTFSVKMEHGARLHVRNPAGSSPALVLCGSVQSWRRVLGAHVEISISAAFYCGVDSELGALPSMPCPVL